MAKKLFENHTDMLQVVYDASGTKYEVVPGGTLEGEQADLGRYGCLREVKTEKK